VSYYQELTVINTYRVTILFRAISGFIDFVMGSTYPSRPPEEKQRESQQPTTELVEVQQQSLLLDTRRGTNPKPFKERRGHNRFIRFLNEFSCSSLNTNSTLVASTLTEG